MSATKVSYELPGCGGRKRVARGQDSKPPSRVARQLVLAYCVERAIDQGVLRDYADAAAKLGFTRARMSQVMDLLVLSPSIQERILSGGLRRSERSLRAAGANLLWREQEETIE